MDIVRLLLVGPWLWRLDGIAIGLLVPPMYF